MLSELEAAQASEVTGIVPSSVTKSVFVTGWYRYVAVYDLSSADVRKTTPYCLVYMSYLINSLS